MNKKSTSLVDSFVFQKAKQNTDLIQQDNIEPSYVGQLSENSLTFVGQLSENSPTFDRQLSDNCRSKDHPLTDLKPSINNKPTLTQHVTDLNPTFDQHQRINISDPIWNLTDRQAIILGYLIFNKSKIIQRKKLIHETGITEASVKNSLKVLHIERFITKPVRWKNKGSVYEIYVDICKRFIELRWPEIISKYGDPPKLKNEQNEQNEQPTINQQLTNNKPTIDQKKITDYEPSSLSSSRFLNKNPSSTKPKIDEIETILKNHPELGYWRQKNLTPKQILNWLKIAQCKLEVMILYLSYCAFDMIDNKNEKNIKKTVFDYFFRIIERSGHYPKPQNYKSHQQKQIEDMEKLVTEKEATAKRMKELREKQINAEKDIKFQEMFNNPESDLYKECFDSLNTFGKNSSRIGGKTFESVMKNAYNELLKKKEKEIINMSLKEN